MNTIVTGSSGIDLRKERLNGYLAELRNCVKEDCDFYLEHDEAREFYDYICSLDDQIEWLKQQCDDLEMDIGCGYDK